MSLQRRVGMPLDNTQRDVSNRDSLSDRTVHADMEMFTGSMSCHASHRRRTGGLKIPNGVDAVFLISLFSFFLQSPSLNVVTGISARKTGGRKREKGKGNCYSRAGDRGWKIFRNKNGNFSGVDFIPHSVWVFSRAEYAKGAFVFLLISMRREITRRRP